MSLWMLMLLIFAAGAIGGAINALFAGRCERDGKKATE